MQENLDIINSISSVITKTGVSKAGNPYNYLEFNFINGYSTRMFLNSDSVFAIRDAYKQTKTELKENKNENSNFWD